jgi:acyl-CoA synthetase (AMP-forming)/AMP-acid ligase II
VGSTPELPYLPCLPAILRRAAEKFGDSDFVVLPDRRISFRQVEAASRHLAKRLLAAGVGKGTRVGIHLPTGPECAVAWLAVTRIGGLSMIFSTFYRPAELRKTMRLGDVAVLLTQREMLGNDHESFMERALPGLDASSASRLRLPELPYLRAIWVRGDTDRAWADTYLTPSDARDGVVDGIDDDFLEAVESEVKPADEMVVVFTSGTSADPKGVIHTHGTVVRKTSAIADASLDPTFAGRILSLTPFFWIGGIQMLAGALQGGGAILTLERNEPSAAIELGEREQATDIMGNAAVLRSLMGAEGGRGAISSLRPPAKRPWDGEPNNRGDRPFGFGMTETMGPWNGVRGFEWRVVDPESGKDLPEGEDGEFWVRGYGLMAGLYKREREDTFTPDGFYRTGDHGYVGPGSVFFKGRLTEMIKTRGANVAPPEVEAVLNDLPGVRVSFVMGLPHQTYGQEVAAALLAEDPEVFDFDQILVQARRELSSYKVPTYVEQITEADIEWLPTGKPNRRALADLLLKRRAESGSVIA